VIGLSHESSAIPSSLQSKYEMLLRLAVNVDESQGLDVGQLVSALQEQSEKIIQLEAALVQTQSQLKQSQVNS
jgi:hypothetical protein